MVGFEAPMFEILEVGRSRASRVEEAQSEAGSLTGRSDIFWVNGGGFNIVGV